MTIDSASENKIKENKYKILRMSLLLGNDENREETLRNFEEAAKEIDNMNNEIYLEDLKDKFYDTVTLEEEAKKMELLVDFIGGRVDQRESLINDFKNITGVELKGLNEISYYDKLEEYRDRLKYINEYLSNTEKLEELNAEVKDLEDKLKDTCISKEKEETQNLNEENQLLEKYKNTVLSKDIIEGIDIDNIDNELITIEKNVDESKKSLDIFNKSFETLEDAGISKEEKEEYKSYVESAKKSYYLNKEKQYILEIYKLLSNIESEYNKVIYKRDNINNILYERISLRRDLEIVDNDNLESIYDMLDRQYNSIKVQKQTIEMIDYLSSEIDARETIIKSLEKDNQKVEILSLLKEFCIIDVYDDIEEKTNSDDNTELNDNNDTNNSIEYNNLESYSIDSNVENNINFVEEEQSQVPQSSDNPPEENLDFPVNNNSYPDNNEEVVNDFTIDNSQNELQDVSPNEFNIPENNFNNSEETVNLQENENKEELEIPNIPANEFNPPIDIPTPIVNNEPEIEEKINIPANEFNPPIDNVDIPAVDIPTPANVDLSSTNSVENVISTDNQEIIEPTPIEEQKDIPILEPIANNEVNPIDLNTTSTIEDEEEQQQTKVEKNQVVNVKDISTDVDINSVIEKANTVMKRVGKMLGIEIKEENKIVPPTTDVTENKTEDNNVNNENPESENNNDYIIPVNNENMFFDNDLNVPESDNGLNDLPDLNQPINTNDNFLSNNFDNNKAEVE